MDTSEKALLEVLTAALAQVQDDIAQAPTALTAMAAKQERQRIIQQINLITNQKKTKKNGKKNQ